GIARKLASAAIEEAAKKRELQYGDIKKIEKGVRRHFHDDITVIVMYLDDHQRGIVGQGSSAAKKQPSLGYYVSPPVDIFSHNYDE
ncbi:hypothetical protein M569_09309, partial [Genlisea aurea]